MGRKFQFDKFIKAKMETQINKKEKFSFFKSLMNTQNLIYHKKELVKYNKISRSFTDLSRTNSMKTFNIYNPSTVCKKNIEHSQTYKILKQGQFQKKLSTFQPKIENFRQRKQRNSKILDKLIQISDSSPTFDKLIRKSPDLHKISIHQRNVKYRSIDDKNMQIGKVILQTKSNYSLQNLNKNRHYSTLLEKRKLRLSQSKLQSNTYYESIRSSNRSNLNYFGQKQTKSFFTAYQNNEQRGQRSITQKINQVVQNSERCIQNLKTTGSQFKQKKNNMKNHVQMSQKLRKEKLAINMIKSRNFKQRQVKSKIFNSNNHTCK